MMLFPTTLWGFRRTVSVNTGKCHRRTCLKRTGTKYGHRYVCSLHALQKAEAERKQQEANAS